MGSSAAAEEDDRAQVCDNPSHFFIPNFDLHSNIMAVHRKTSVSGQPTLISVHVTARKATAPATAIVASSSAGGTG
jgi:hypothetical protein